MLGNRLISLVFWHLQLRVKVDLGQSESEEVVVLEDYRRLVTPETGKVPPCFEYDVNGEDEGNQDVNKDELDDIIEEHCELPGDNSGEEH